jgi:hypothetical protein
MTIRGAVMLATAEGPRTLGWLDRHAAVSEGAAARPGLKRKP